MRGAPQPAKDSPTGRLKITTTPSIKQNKFIILIAIPNKAINQLTFRVVVAKIELSLVRDYSPNLSTRLLANIY